MAKFKTVAEVFEDPARWCIHDFAQDSSGVPVDPQSWAACKWCLLGAVSKVYGCKPEYMTVLTKLYSLFRKRYPDLERMSVLNDTTSVEVVRQFAIEAGV